MSSLAHYCFTKFVQREDYRGITAHGCSPQGGKREEERGHSARMATAPEVGSTKGEGSHSSCCGDDVPAEWRVTLGRWFS